jgi:hypothetical protein
MPSMKDIASIHREDIGAIGTAIAERFAVVAMYLLKPQPPLVSIRDGNFF